MNETQLMIIKQIGKIVEAKAIIELQMMKLNESRERADEIHTQLIRLLEYTKGEHEVEL